MSFICQDHKITRIAWEEQEEDSVKIVYEGDRVYHKIIIHEEYQAAGSRNDVLVEIPVVGVGYNV